MMHMVGITNIASYIPQKSISNYDLKDKFEMDDDFIIEKIGVDSVTRKQEDESTSDMGVKAFNLLIDKTEIDKDNVECLFVVTQNPDYNIPHTSAVVHGKMGLPEYCACFDISLGCSGYVYGLSVIKSFMQENGMTKGVLITADPYSIIINEEDKNTSILFGDGATATLLSDEPIFELGKFTFGTIGKDYDKLICENNLLCMNGRAIFNFAAKYVPKDIKKVLEDNNVTIDDIDSFIFHQGSKYIVDTITKRLKLEPSKVPFGIQKYGNTVSSSIPILLEEIMKKEKIKTIAISGFGVGLSWSSSIIRRIN